MPQSTLLSRFSARLPTGCAIYAVFFIESSVLAQWIPRIPDIKSALQLGDAQLGIALLFMPFGTLLGLSVAGRVIERLGLGGACRLFMPVWALLFIGPGLASSFATLCLALAIAGVAIGMIETAMNTEAARQEGFYGTRLMSRCHGFWSLGSMVGVLCAGAIAQTGVGTAAHFFVAMPLLAVLGWLAARLLPDERADESALAAGNAGDVVIEPESAAPAVADEGPIFRWPTRTLLPLCVLPLGLMMIEGMFIDWSAVFVREVLAGSALAVAIVYAAFSSVMAVTRLSGDWLATRFGDVPLVRASALCGIAGAMLFALSSTTTIALLGAALAGVGCAVVFPLAMSAVGKRTDRPAADNVAALNMISFSAFLLAPPLIGFLAEAFSLRIAILALVPGAMLSLYLSSELSVNAGLWRERVPMDAYRVLFRHATERPGSSALNDEQRAGEFVCRACGLPLFASEAKFDSGTGWPSFFSAIDGSLEMSRDFRLIVPRTEYHCAGCGGHQGHLFDDGPPPTGKRYCNNGVALRFVEPGDEALTPR